MPRKWGIIGTGSSIRLQIVAYYRVSTQRQGQSGLGLEAQQSNVQALAQQRNAEVVAEFTEVESGRKNDRPVLAQALAAAREHGAVIAIAKLDRLARDAEFVLRLAREAEANGMGGFLFCDLPDVDATTAAGRMVLTVMASVAEFESRRISERTKDAMAVAKTKGQSFGGRREAAVAAARARRGEAVKRAEALRGVLAPMVAAGQSQRQIAAALNAAGHRTERGSEWSHKTVGRVVERLELA